MIAVLGSFRLPADRVQEALPEMRKVIAASLQEAGCLAYSYAEDVMEPGLFRVHEMWSSREALALHFEKPHMTEWTAIRETLGFSDRRIRLFDLGANGDGAGEEL